MKHLFNPFGFIFEESDSHYSPHTRTLRTSLLHKLKDAFFVLFGGKSVFNSAGRLGLLDYLPFLGLSFLSSLLLDAAGKLKDEYPKLSATLSLMAVIFVAIFAALKALIAVVCLIPSFLIIAGTHVVARIIARKEIALVENMVFFPTDNIDTNTKMTLSDLCSKASYSAVNEATCVVENDMVKLEIMMPFGSGCQIGRSFEINRALPDQLEAFKALKFFDVYNQSSALEPQPKLGRSR
jgi:hypothetical protein